MSEFNNVEFRLEGKKLTIVVPDITKDFGPSKSERTNVIASTHGFTTVSEELGVILSVSVNKRIPKAERKAKAAPVVAPKATAKAPVKRTRK
jgi:hypothetical protein